MGREELCDAVWQVRRLDRSTVRLGRDDGLTRRRVMNLNNRIERTNKPQQKPSTINAR